MRLIRLFAGLWLAVGLSAALYAAEGEGWGHSPSLLIDTRTLEGAKSSPSLLIEFAYQDLGGNPLNHIHTQYRNPKNDYGSSLKQ